MEAGVYLPKLRWRTASCRTWRTLPFWWEDQVKVVGVDGCRGGWIAIVWDTSAATVTPRFHATFSEIVDSYPDAACIGIDIPIGLRDDGLPRSCDVDARQLLGWPRMASVFPAPQRQLLACANYSAATTLSRERFGRGVSRQAFGIFGKVAEVDQLITPALQRRIVEVHPELSLWTMNGRQAMGYSKKLPEGFDERREQLAHHVHAEIPESCVAARQLAPFAAADDLLDAMTVAWTARRAATQAANRIPAQPELDARGLRMEIVY
ncbi:MAG TPA: DUF429 domain-containing protein [Thermomicrobiales bacterium]|nr:DUF429 domain-containing protein [Thermomicrobiales bacterium]